MLCDKVSTFMILKRNRDEVRWYIYSVECTEDDFLNDEERRCSFFLETLDIQLTCISGTGDKLDICLIVKSEDEGCEVLKVKKNEIMNSSFQVKCFHR